MGLIVGLVLSLSVGYLVFAGTRRWYYSDWNWFWGCLLGWIVVISQAIIILSGQQFDKKRITVKIRLVENMEKLPPLGVLC
ncbi:hypothetical protein BGZ57DRAFT_880412 [Hyaloscypha finlandica]|nr:hypothetical protein BGZ57DRAFT_880412 [Hyaloscypha finlandica]